MHICNNRWHVIQPPCFRNGDLRNKEKIVSSAKKTSNLFLKLFHKFMNFENLVCQLSLRNLREQKWKSVVVSFRENIKYDFCIKQKKGQIPFCFYAYLPCTCYCKCNSWKAFGFNTSAKSWSGNGSRSSPLPSRIGRKILVSLPQTNHYTMELHN